MLHTSLYKQFESIMQNTGLFYCDWIEIIHFVKENLLNLNSVAFHIPTYKIMRTIKVDSVNNILMK